MDARAILHNINADLAAAPARRVIYMEGDTDPPLFFALLGLTTAVSGSYVHQNTLVKGLGGKGKVAQYLSAAAGNGLAARVVGIADGDGELYAALQPKFDHPFGGPLYTWKAYCIESLFPLCTWDPSWGAAPNWQTALADYAPYVGLSRTYLRLARVQKDIGLAQYARPDISVPLLTFAGEKARLGTEKSKIMSFDAESIFDQEVKVFLDALKNGVHEAIALLDGKWLLKDFMVRHSGKGNYKFWMGDWIRHTTAAGGLTEVKQLWQRIVGTAP